MHMSLYLVFLCFRIVRSMEISKMISVWRNFFSYSDFSNWWIATILKVKIEDLVMSMGGVLLSRSSSDVNFIIVKNVLAGKYKVYCSKIVIYILLPYVDSH